MAQDQNKKTLRHFQCRDYLWDIFEQMSAELECSTDYLINESMRQYARSRNYGTNRSSSEQPRSSQGSAPAIPSLRSSAQRSAPAAPPTRPASRVAAPPAGAASSKASPSSLPPPPPPSTARNSSSAAMPAAPAAPRPQSTASMAPPPLPGGSRGPAVAATAANAKPTLFVVFNGQKIPITKEEFVIGRGSKSADLPIKDGNISRRHAAVVFQNGAFFMKDLGSTNGIEFDGRRVDTRRIEDGDLYRLCDYELRFTYR